MKEPLYVLDGYGLIYRAYFAFINRPLTDSTGANISAIFGFFRTLLTLLRDEEPRYLAVALDPAGPTFRHERYPEYKATRDRAPEDLHAQVPAIEAILRDWGVPVLRVDGYEADDVMGTLARMCRDEGRPCVLVSSDKDLMQLVDESVTLLRPERGGDFRRFGPAEVKAEKGVRPDQMIDYLALIGDSSDNIPGVEGIGPKTAAALLETWESLDGVYENLENAAKGARKAKLEAGRDSAVFSRELVTIRLDVPLASGPGEMSAFDGDVSAAAAGLRNAEIPSLADELDGGSGRAAPTSATAPSGRYEAVLTAEGLGHWGKKIREAGLAAVDTETDSIDPLRANLVGVSLSVEAGEGAYIPLDCPDAACLPRADVVAWMNEIFSDGAIRIIGQNFKYDMKVLARAGVTIGGPWFDTMIAGWILDASGKVNMDVLAERYLDYTTVHFTDIVPKGGTFAEVPLAEAVTYAAEDADITYRLYEKFRPALEEDPRRQEIFRDIETPLIPLLAEMETTGIGMDVPSLEAFGEELEEGIRRLESEIHELCGKEFNVASPKQLQEILFVDRKLTPTKKTKSGWSTDNTVLMELAKEDPVPEKILLYRSLTKLKSTYVDALPKMVNPETGRIHTNYVQTGAATGRLASKDPNLQNIPVRDENGRRIRQAFRPRPGCAFVSADYSQIELVVLSYMSGDEALREAFRTGEDVHRRTASLLFGVEPGEVSGEQRRMAKAVNFGVMYGMSAFRLSNELGISRSDAKSFIEAYFATYVGIRTFVDETVAGAESEGGVRTLYGRFRPLPGITSRNRVEKSAAERAAVNSRIQGTAADIVKIAMLRIDRRLKDEGREARMLLQVHDEVVLEVPEAEIDTVTRLLREEMEGAADLAVPLRVNVETGPTWGDIH